MLIDTKMFSDSAEKIEQIRTLSLDADKISSCINGLRDLNSVLSEYANILNSIGSTIEHLTELAQLQNNNIDAIGTEVLNMKKLNNL